MKNKDIHKGLDKAEIRDFISEELKSVDYGAGCAEAIKKKITELECELEKARRAEAIHALIKHMGWDWFDISDEIEDYSRVTYRSFVGTKKERDMVFNR